jgi:hypothetical protein
MPTPEENMQSVRTFAEQVFGNKNLTYAADWLADDFVEHQVFPGTTPDKKGAIDSYRIFFAASPGTVRAPGARRPAVARLAQSDAIAVTGALRYSADYVYEP